MLQRASGLEADDSECDDPMVTLVCNADPENALCPEACRPSEKDEPEEPTVVKAGDLVVTAEAAANRKVLRDWTSDLDTLTFKTSENVSITKVTLERYGYSTSDNVEEVRLEDQDGNVIADAKGLTKDKVTLSVKKDYRSVDGSFDATLVVKTTAATGGSTLGFKVTAVESTAENLNLKDYDPNTYDIVDYAGSEVTVELKGTPKTYNYTEGESYEIARVRVAAGAGAILVKGFTLTNAGKVDMKESLDELVVKADSKEIDAKFSINKDDELVVTFDDEYEIDMSKKVTFILNASFAEFDDYGESVKYYIAETADFNAVEKKNDTRVNLNIGKAGSTSAVAYTFNGGKIKLSNVKLWNVDAAQGSEGIVIAEGNVTVTEPISKANFSIVVPSVYVEKLTMKVNGEEYEGTDRTVKLITGATFSYKTQYKDTADFYTGDAELVSTSSSSSSIKVISCYDSNGSSKSEYIDKTLTIKAPAEKVMAWNWDLYLGTTDTDMNLVSATMITEAKGNTQFTFKNVAIEKSGKIQFTVDIADDALAAGLFQIAGSFGGDQLSGAKYDNVSKQYVNAADVAGSIAFSKVTIQPAKAALENKLTKDVEFLKNETARKVVFDGTYTAKKGDIDLNKFMVSANSNAFTGKNKVTFYLSIDGEEIADTDTLGVEESFSDIRVKAGESVSIKIEAELEAYGEDTDKTASYQFEIKGTDMNGNTDTGRGSDRLMWMKLKAKGTVTIPSTAEAKTALLKASNTTIAKFTVKPSNGNEWLVLEDMVITGRNITKNEDIASTDLRVKVAGVEQDDDSTTYYVNEEIPTEGLVVEVILKNEQAGKIEVNVASVNGKDFNNKYAKYLVESLVSFTRQEEGTTSTEYEVSVEHSDDSYSVRNFNMYAYSGSTCETTALKTISEISDWESFTIMRGDKAAEICRVSYDVCTNTECSGDWKVEAVSIVKDTYKDYFKVGGKELAIPKA